MAKEIFNDIRRIMPEISDVTVAIWHTSMLEKMSPEQISSYFTPVELEDCDGFSHAQRKNEWLAARIALKRLLIKDGLIQNPQHMSVRKTELGAPYIVIYEPNTGRYARLNCSLSHKDKIVLVAYARNKKQRVGLDLEKRSWRIPCLRRKFVADRDSLIEKGDYIGDKTILWTFKEATSKVRGTGFRCGFRNICCVEKSLGLCEIVDEENTNYVGHYTWFDQYAISVVLDVLPFEPERIILPRKYNFWQRIARARRLKEIKALRSNKIQSSNQLVVRI